MIHHTVSLVKMLVTTASTSAATATSVAHCRVVLGSHLAVAVTGTHHREDLGETLAILGAKYNLLQSESLLLTLAILSDGSLNGNLFQAW